MARCRSESAVRRIGSGRRGHLDGAARDAELNRPFGVCALRDGVLAFTDAHHNAVRFVIPATTRDGCGLVRRRCHVKTVENSGLLAPKGIAASADGRHLFVCDTGHHKIKFAALPSRSALADVDAVTDEVAMFAFAGSGKKGWRDGLALEANFNSPSGVCEYADGSIIVADAGNHCIRQIRRGVNGKLIVKTIAGAYASLETKRVGVQGAGIRDKRTAGYRDGERSLFRSPSAVIAGSSGELLVADTMNNCIRGLLPPSDETSPWRVSTVCGQTRPGHADGNCEVALFDQPVSLCWGEDSNTFFVADRGNACIRQVGRSYGDGLSYTWVRTIEVGGVPRAPRSLYQCTNPLGMVCIPCQPTEDGYSASQLVVCDGGDNVIKLLPLGELVNVKERFDTPKLLETTTMRSTFPHSESGPQSRGESTASLSPRTNYTDSEDLGEENQLENDCGGCPCDASRALEEVLRANAALQAENLRLRELLQCTFDEIELADKRFSDNYQPQLHVIEEASKLSPEQQSKVALPTK